MPGGFCALNRSAAYLQEKLPPVPNAKSFRLACSRESGDAFSYGRSAKTDLVGVIGLFRSRASLEAIKETDDEAQEIRNS
jgi:hypothetical protein